MSGYRLGGGEERAVKVGEFVLRYGDGLRGVG